MRKDWGSFTVLRKVAAVCLALSIFTFGVCSASEEPTRLLPGVGKQPGTIDHDADGHTLTAFVRDITTGYLLNCSFLSPRPYCWTKEDYMLSGWEVDQSGGHFAFQPTCKYPEGFGFHSDWFKLVDVNPDAAVTLRHRIARQTTGEITVEFRFSLPSQMDGAYWQLCDLDKAAVNIVIQKGDLCAEDDKGGFTKLAHIEDGRDYGVKIVADIGEKQADIFLDGELCASDAPFACHVETIDCFLAGTGTAAIGEMFLNPVNIFKGYLLNETFVTCGTGKAPSDWETSHASVQMFECASKPDVFSLKLDSPPETHAVAKKRFTPEKGKTVFEFRFLIPEKRDGVSVDIIGQEGGIAIVTMNGDVCLDDGHSTPALLLRNYLPNFWYMFKIAIDPDTNIVDAHVNGKPSVTNMTLGDELKALDAIQFSAGPATALWIDDVSVYPWRDYPDDYVPEPKPVMAENGILLGVQSCNLWREGTAYAGWDYVYPYRDQRKPFLGWYDEGNPEETDWEIKWLVEHGITFEQRCWYRPNNAVNNPIKDGVLDHGLIKGLFNARYSNLNRFTIMYTNEGAGETNPLDWRENIIPYWIEYFFKDSRYLKIDGRPVVSIYHLGNFMRMFNGEDGARQAVQTLRNMVEDSGFPGVIVLMEERAADPTTLKMMKSLGVDYCYAYTWGTPDAKVQRKKNMAQRDAAMAAGLGSLTSLSMGWNREAWGVQDGGWLSPKDYETLVAWARDEFIPSLPEQSLGRRMVMLANWNEFGEGHFLMPSTLAGFGYLDGLRNVFTGGGQHEDIRPTAAQMGRFTVLYPKE